MNTTSNLSATTVNGPIHETASFRYNGYCAAVTVPAPAAECIPANESLQFRESGLPVGTTWAVTTWTPGVSDGLPETTSSTDPTLSVNGSGLSAPTDYLLWGCASSVFPGAGCLANSTPPSPVEVPQTTNVSVAFSRSTSTPSGPFSLLVAAIGLPNASTPWSLSVGGTVLPEPDADVLLSLGGGSYELNGSAVYPSPGVECVVQGIELRNLTVGSTWQSFGTTPARFTLAGPAMVTIIYNESFEVTVVAGIGGHVTPASPVWASSGGTVAISATPLPGYSFVQWSSTGGGSYGGGLATLNISVYTPVTELAVFRPPSPALDTVTISETGIPESTPYTVFLNGTGFTGNGSFPVLLPPGRVAVGWPTDFPGNDSLSRYVPNGTRTGGGVQSSGDAVVISGNGSLGVAFAVQVRPPAPRRRTRVDLALPGDHVGQRRRVRPPASDPGIPARTSLAGTGARRAMRPP